MMIGFISLGCEAIKYLRIRHMGLVCIMIRFGLSLFFLVLRITVMLDNIQCIFNNRALVDLMILVWIR